MTGFSREGRAELAYNRGRADFFASLQAPSFDLSNPFHSMDEAEEYDAWDRGVMDALTDRCRSAPADDPPVVLDPLKLGLLPLHPLAAHADIGIDRPAMGDRDAERLHGLIE